MSASPDFERGGIRVWGATGGARLQIDIEGRAAEGGDRAGIDRRWEELRARNPRLHDGEILSVRWFEPAGRIGCVRDRFRRLAVRGEVETGARLLGVTGVFWLGGGDGEARGVLVKRGEQTLHYGGLWEIGPSGGIDPPGEGASGLGFEEVVGALRAELREELGWACDPGGARVVGFLGDEVAGSLDVVVSCALEGAMPVRKGSPSWEVRGVREAGLWEVARGADVAPPSGALARWLLEAGGLGVERC